MNIEPIYPSKNEIMNFFKTHAGYIQVFRICELLIVPRNNVQPEEIEHIRFFLHELKSNDFLLVKNEGQDIYYEEFSSTPDRVKKYFSKDVFEDNRDLTKKSEEELLAIIRRAENTNVAGSLYQRASKELELRDRDKIINNQSRSGLMLRVGGDMLFDGSIKGPENGKIDIAVAGNYKSHKGQIIQGDNNRKWWENSWVQGIALVAAILGIVGFFLLFK